jgi:hypothetical protein
MPPRYCGPRPHHPHAVAVNGGRAGPANLQFGHEAVSPDGTIGFISVYVNIPITVVVAGFDIERRGWHGWSRGCLGRVPRGRAAALGSRSTHLRSRTPRPRRVAVLLAILVALGIGYFIGNDQAKHLPTLTGDAVVGDNIATLRVGNDSYALRGSVNWTDSVRVSACADPRTTQPTAQAPGEGWAHDRRQQGLGRSVGSHIEDEYPIALPEPRVAGPFDNRRSDVG